MHSFHNRQSILGTGHLLIDVTCVFGFCRRNLCRGLGRAAAPKAKRGPQSSSVIKDPNAPKKPGSAYNFFTKVKTAEVSGRIPPQSCFRPAIERFLQPTVWIWCSRIVISPRVLELGSARVTASVRRSHKEVASRNTLRLKSRCHAGLSPERS